MLDFIRKHASTWYSKVFLGLLALCFVILWGGGDLLRQGLVGKGQTVLTIGSHTISTSEVAHEFQRMIHTLQLQTGKSFTSEEAKKAGLLNQVLRSMIQKTLIDLECDRLGLVVTDETIRKTTQENPLFLDESKTFQPERFHRFLSALSLKETEYIAEMRGDLRRSQLLTALTLGVIPPKGMVERLYKWQHEKRLVKIGLVPASSIKNLPSPKEEELKAFYEENADVLFMVPEKRSLKVLLFGKDNAEVTIDPSKIEEVYAQKRETDFEGKSLLLVSQQIEKELKEEGKEKALEDLRHKIEDLEASGTPLEKIAEKFNLKLVDLPNVSQGETLKNDHLSEALVPLVLEKGFSTQVQTSSETFETPSGEYGIVRVEVINPSHKKPFEEHQEEVKKHWLMKRQLQEASEKAKKLAEKAGQEGESVLKGLSVKTLTLERQNNPEALKVGLTPESVGRIFSLSGVPHAIHTEATLEPGSLVIVLEKIIPIDTKKSGDPQKFNEFKERVRSLLSNDILEIYLGTLENRYRVEVNKKALAAF